MSDCPAFNLKQVDAKWVQGKHLNYFDEGPIRPKALTRRYAVKSRFNGQLVGYVRWWATWRKYVFAPLNSVFDEKCLNEVASFCAIVTDEQKTGAKLLWEM